MPRNKKSIDKQIESLKLQIEFLKKQIPKKENHRPTLFNENQIKMLELACQFPGITEEGVCNILGVTRSTLEKFIRRKYDMTYSAFRDQKKGKMHYMLRAKQFEIAMKGNVSMLIWLGKNELDQTDKNQTVLGNSKSEGSAEPFQLIIHPPIKSNAES